jgi:hypothetical protein
VNESSVRHSVDQVLGLVAGVIAPEQVEVNFAPRLTLRGSLTAMVAADPRFEGLHGHPAEVVRVTVTGTSSGVALLRSNEQLWELDVAVESAAPHRVRSFQPRRAGGDAVEWPRVAERLRAGDHYESTLSHPSAERIHSRLLDAVRSGGLAGLSCRASLEGVAVHREVLGTSDIRTFAALSEQSSFRVGSVTKVVTALAVLHCVQDGLIDLHAPLSQYLPVPELAQASPEDPEPTVAQLLLQAYRYAGGMIADLPSLLTLAEVVGRADDPLVRTLRSLTTPVGKGGHFIPGLAVLDLPSRSILWRGGSTPGFTTEIVAATDGSAAVVLLAATHPARELRDTGVRILNELLDK